MNTTRMCVLQHILAQICKHPNGIYELSFTEGPDQPCVNVQAGLMGFYCLHMSEGTFTRLEFNFNVNVTDPEIILLGKCDRSKYSFIK